jgi:hypothetical protein
MNSFHGPVYDSICDLDASAHLANVHEAVVSTVPQFRAGALLLS